LRLNFSALALCSALLLAACDGGKNSSPPPAPVNRAPVASAGADQTVVIGTPAVLNGAASTDPDGDALTYSWEVIPPVDHDGTVLSSQTTVSTTLVPNISGTFTVRLKVADSKGLSSTDEMLVTVPNPWSMGAAMPTQRYSPRVAVVGAKIYVIGGSNPSNPNAGLATTIEAYDSTANIWASVPKFPTDRFNISAAAIGTKIYVIGGTIPNGGSTNIVEELDTSTGTWASKAPLLENRSLVTPAVVATKLYVISGRIDSRISMDWTTTHTPAIDVYDQPTDMWAAHGAIPARAPDLGKNTFQTASTAIIGGQIYVMAPTVQDGIIIGTVSKAAYRYDPDAQTWTRLADMPVSIEQSGGSRIAVIGNTIYAIGDTAVAVYNTATGVWETQRARMPSTTGPVAAIGSKIYMFTPNATYIYDPTLDRPH
jgi:N-acetylneuraminic acid mutarotase